MKLLILFIFASCSTQVIKTEKDLDFNGSYYVNESSVDFVSDIIKITDCVTRNEKFHKEILDVKKFEHYSGENKHIISQLLSEKVSPVGTFYKKFGKVRAYRNIGSDKIWLNRAKISKADADLVNTMIHERLHVLGFTHKGNKKYKFNNINSVPYKVGSISEKYFEVCN